MASIVFSLLIRALACLVAFHTGMVLLDTVRASSASYLAEAGLEPVTDGAAAVTVPRVIACSGCQ